MLSLVTLILQQTEHMLSLVTQILQQTEHMLSLMTQILQQMEHMLSLVTLILLQTEHMLSLVTHIFRIGQSSNGRDRKTFEVMTSTIRNISSKSHVAMDFNSIKNCLKIHVTLGLSEAINRMAYPK